MTISLLQTDIINIEKWKKDDTHEGVYPQGARDKYTLFNSDGKQFMFKSSWKSKNNDDEVGDQFWVEIIAYYVGVLLGVDVPQTFVTYDGKEYGALIEWFYDSDIYSIINGGSYMQKKIANYGFRRGKEHNLETMLDTLKDDGFSERKIIDHWKDIFLFDALIGNTDRHQDNWEIIVKKSDNNVKLFSPAFDNGTSLGWRSDVDLRGKGLENFITKSLSHMRWNTLSTKRITHFEFLKNFIDTYPYTRDSLYNKINFFSLDRLEKLLELLLIISDKVLCNQALSKERSDFIFGILKIRKTKLLELLK